MDKNDPGFFSGDATADDRPSTFRAYHEEVAQTIDGKLHRYVSLMEKLMKRMDRMQVDLNYSKVLPCEIWCNDYSFIHTPLPEVFDPQFYGQWPVLRMRAFFHE